jgi:MHS family proline/betaine transporter-like MFS transporter
MFKTKINDLSQKQRDVIRTISCGNILEWYDVYSYGLQAPVIAKNFFNFLPEEFALLCALILFGLGSVIRPFSVLLFGKIADHNLSENRCFIKLANLIGIGRKPTFVLSIILTTIATCLTGCLGTYNSWGITAPILLIFLRILTSIGLSAEYTGAICYLYENSYPLNARSVTSWTGVGNQLGGMIGILESLLFALFASVPFIESWGWRISFWMGAVIGIFIAFLRIKLSETPLYEAIEERNKFDHETSFKIVKTNFQKIWLGIGFGVINASTYYFLAIYLPTFLVRELGIKEIMSNCASLFILFISTVLIPIFGRIGDKYSNKTLLIRSVAFMLLLLPAVYYSIATKKLILLCIIGIIYTFPVSCITALLGFQLPRLFRTDVRFTCVGVSWNIADAIIGGLTPAILMLLQLLMNSSGSLCIFILLTGIVSMCCYTKIIEE